MEDDGPELDAELAKARLREKLFGVRPDPVVVGRYRLEEKIGAGAMGIVFAAHDPTLDRRVAVKVARAVGATEQQTARSMREAQALARLAHPNVVTVHDVGVHRGRLFVAMELVDGETLTAWVRRARPTAERIVAVIEEAGRGLAAAHARGMVHRDVKPENVLVTREGRAKVLDFGLVRAADALEERVSMPASPGVPLETRLTDTFAVLGTPAYMAPEQLEGGDVDARADVYALAATAYEALFGALPHPADTPRALIESVLRGEARRPSPGSGVPAQVEAAVMRALSRDPAARQSTMEAFLADLHGPAAAPRGRTAMVGTALLTLAVLAGVALAAGLESDDPPRMAPVAIDPGRPVLVALDAGAPRTGVRDAGAAAPMRDAGAAASSVPDAGPADAGRRGITTRRPSRDAGTRRARDAGPATTAAPDAELDTGPFVRDVVRRCWRYHLEVHPAAPATPVTLVLRVAPSGEVIHVDAESLSNVPTLLQCIESRGRDWQGFARAEHERRASRMVLLREP